jgi:hypothetical protein
MSEAQKHALAKGRHALRLKLEEMGAGRPPLQGTYFMEHSGTSLAPAGYTISPAGYVG